MRNIVHFIAIFTFVLGIVAPACGFAWGGISSDGQYSVIEICSANGYESRIVKNDKDTPEHETKEPCQFCFANTYLNDLVPILVTERFYSYQAQYIFNQYEIAFLSRSTSHEQPRGPPTPV